MRINSGLSLGLAEVRRGESMAQPSPARPGACWWSLAVLLGWAGLCLGLFEEDVQAQRHSWLHPLPRVRGAAGAGGGAAQQGPADWSLLPDQMG